VLWVLLALLLLALVAVAVLAWQLVEARRETAQLQEALERQLEQSRPRPAVAQAASIVSRVVDAASRVREQGVTGMLRSSLEDFTRWATEQRAEIGRMAADDGTVTIMFTDIEGSTVLNSTLGDGRFVRLLAAHDELVETYVEKYRGLIVKSQGDGHMVVFSTPALALDAAWDIQRAFGAKWNHSRELRRTPVKVRIGVHTGTAVERDGDYFGRNVALAARVAAEGDGGEIVVSGEVAEAGAGRYAFVHAGTVELKGFDGEHELWKVEEKLDA
jgi:class 3 adenylate cyclase